jgi:hypothetical protein
MLPEPNTEVLAWIRLHPDGAPFWCIAVRGESWLHPEKGIFWFTDTGREIYEVLAWQSLPPPPAAENPLTMQHQEPDRRTLSTATILLRTFTDPSSLERIRELEDDWAMQGPARRCEACPTPAWCWLDAGWPLLSLCRSHAQQVCYGLGDRLAEPHA